MTAKPSTSGLGVNIMNEVIDEIRVIMNSFGYDEDAAIGWIKANIGEYDSVFRCDLNRYLSGDAISREFGVIYESVA